VIHVYALMNLLKFNSLGCKISVLIVTVSGYQCCGA
jgi:hypothetical protein